MHHLRIATPSETPVDDARLLVRVASGDRAALGELYERYARAVFLFASRLVRDGSADDIVQHVFLRVTQIAPAFDASSVSAKPWLFGITVQVVREQRRSSRRFARLLAGVLGSNRSAAYEPFDRHDELERALDRLTHEKREALMLAEVEGFTCEEIAQMIEVPVGTVYTRLHHARKQLRHHLGDSE